MSLFYQQVLPVWYTQRCWESRKGLLVLWETMIFWPGNDDLENWYRRPTGDKAASAGQKKAVAFEGSVQ